MRIVFALLLALSFSNEVFAKSCVNIFKESVWDEVTQRYDLDFTQFSKSLRCKQKSEYIDASNTVYQGFKSLCVVEYKNSKNELQISLRFLATESSEFSGAGRSFDAQKMKSTEDVMSLTSKDLYFEGDLFPHVVASFKMKVKNLNTQVPELSLKVTERGILSLRKDTLLEATYDCEKEAI